MEQKRKLKSVDTHFWEDSYIDELDPIEKLVFLYLLTNPNCNLAGIYEVSLKKIAYQTGIDRDMLLKIIARFERDEKAYFMSGRIILPNYAKHQNYNPSMMIAVKRALNDLPSELISFLRTLENTPISNFLISYIEGGDSMGTACIDGALQKESEVESEVKKFKSEVEVTSQNLNFSEKIKTLYKNHSRITEPNLQKHITPVLTILDEPYSKKLGEKILGEIVQETFSKLSKSHGVRMEFLIENLRKNISAKHEEIIQKKKSSDLKQAELDRIKHAKEEREQIEEENRIYREELPKKIAIYLNFLRKNKEIFSVKDYHELEKSLLSGSINLAIMLIQPKMDEMELV